MGCDDNWLPEPSPPSELYSTGDELTDKLMNSLKATGSCTYDHQAAFLARTIQKYVEAKISAAMESPHDEAPNGTTIS